MSGTVSDEIPARISPAEDAPLLQVDRVSKHFGGVAAVSAASFLVHHNECVALMGGNGAGKSTVVSLLSGVYGPDSGSIFLDGVAAKFEGPAAARRGGVETVFQSLALCENLDAPANLFLGRELYRGFGPFRVLRRSAMRAEAKEVLRSYGVSIPDLRVATVSLSGGERQALAFARAARCAEKLLILDEPTAALGVVERGRVHNSIIRMREELQLSVLIITHNLSEMRQLAQRVVVMRHGRIVGDWATGDVEDHEIVMAMVGAGEDSRAVKRASEVSDDLAI